MDAHLKIEFFINVEWHFPIEGDMSKHPAAVVITNFIFFPSMQKTFEISNLDEKSALDLITPTISTYYLPNSRKRWHPPVPKIYYWHDY